MRAWIRSSWLNNISADTKAQTWEDWTRSMALGGIPATNFIYADKTGRIAYIYNGLFPDRKPGFNYGKVLPGDTSADIWTGPVPFSAYPKLVNPKSGFVENSTIPLLGRWTRLRNGPKGLFAPPRHRA
jgi:acyl-homoserine lactone acylase PvdQ